MAPAVSLESQLDVPGRRPVERSVWAAAEWGSTSCGQLDPSRMLRLVIPSVTAVTLGSQLVLGSFFLGVLGMRVRKLKLSPA